MIENIQLSIIFAQPILDLIEYDSRMKTINQHVAKHQQIVGQFGF